MAGDTSAMTDAEIRAQVVSIVADKLGVDESKVVPEARFREDLEADSLDLVELIMEFEEKFGGNISDEEAQKNYDGRRSHRLFGSAAKSPSRLNAFGGCVRDTARKFRFTH